MAKKVITTTEFIDDIDGGKAEGTVSFSVNGTQYEIDLSKKNRAAFEKALKPYLDVARKVRGTRRTRSAAGRGYRVDVSDMREWARTNGHAVSERGRIPQEIRDLYEAAH